MACNLLAAIGFGYGQRQDGLRDLQRIPNMLFDVLLHLEASYCFCLCCNAVPRPDTHALHVTHVTPLFDQARFIGPISPTLHHGTEA